MSRTQIGTVTITRPRAYPLDPAALESPTSVFVPIVEYPVFLDGFTRYWRMTGTLNEQFTRLGDGAFRMGPDAPSDDDVVFYSRRYGPDEWAELIAAFEAETDPALVFTLAPQPQN
jgi:hypothetical protein